MLEAKISYSRPSVHVEIMQQSHSLLYSSHRKALGKGRVGQLIYAVGEEAAKLLIPSIDVSSLLPSGFNFGRPPRIAQEEDEEVGVGVGVGAGAGGSSQALFARLLYHNGYIGGKMIRCQLLYRHLAGMHTGLTQDDPLASSTTASSSTSTSTS